MPGESSYSSGSSAHEGGQTGRSGSGRTYTEATAVVHDLFWFLAVPLAFVGAPLVAWALSAVWAVGNFEAAGLGPAAASLASELHSGLLLFAVSGWLFLLAVWFYRTPDPDRSFIDYCRAGTVFALLLYVWALAPSLLSLLLAVFTKFFTKGSA